MASIISSYLLPFLRSGFPYALEYMVFGMAMESAVAVRKQDDSNLKKPYNWFLTLVQISLIGFGGGWLMPLLLGLPSSYLLGADLNTFGCLISWYLVFHSPGDVWYKHVCGFAPFQVFYVSGAQLFRSSGIYGFVDKALNLPMSPSPYYPTPLLGPILTAALLSNIGPIFRLSYPTWFSKGMTSNFQYSFVLGAFYHIYANDEDGFIGVTLRSAVSNAVEKIDVFEDDRDAAKCAVSLFMVIFGCMKLPSFIGPTFDPLSFPSKLLLTVSGVSESNSRKKSTANSKATKKKANVSDTPPKATRKSKRGKKVD